MATTAARSLAGPVPAPVRAPAGPALPDDHLAEVIPLQPRRRPSRAVYWRRRAVALLLLAAVLVGVVAALRTLVAPAADAPRRLVTVTLAPGDTLWDLAVAHTTQDGDPRATLAEIRALNGLTGPTVPAWTPVQVPVGE